MPTNFSEIPQILSELANNVRNPNYWPTLVAKLMKQIPLLPAENPHKDGKLADMVTRCNPKAYNGKYDLVEFEEWVKGMEKIFTVVEVPEEKKVNIGRHYLPGEADI